MPSENRDKIKLVLSILVCLFAAAIGGLLTAPHVGNWYRALLKPPLNPPSWVFGPVWTVLYVLMGIALYLVWRKIPLGKDETRAIAWFFIQLFLNVMWSFCFFYLKNPGLAFFEIVLLWTSIAVTIWMFRRVTLSAGVLLLPYWAWVSFAGYLNFAIWRLNA